MFGLLGQFVARFRVAILIGWVALAALLVSVAPPMLSVLKEGEFAFLPEEAASRQAELQFKEVFPDDLFGSTVIILVRRPSRQTALDADDLSYIHDKLVPVLAGFGVRSSEEEDVTVSPEIVQLTERFPELELSEEESSIIARVRDWTNNSIGHLLNSEDGQASLVLIDLTTEYMEDSNIPVVSKISELRDRLKFLDDPTYRIPAGLEIMLSGSATVGRDMRVATKESGERTESATIILVMILLIIIYRAPLLAMIPLISVYVAVKVAMLLLIVMADAGWIHLFKDIETYITVLIYGTGVDYCLFLISRYKEELDRGATYDEAISLCLEKVGAALAASAATSACGIGMMAFAEFGKFQQSGIGIALSLIVCVTAALTFSPALLRVTGKWAFWPRVPSERIKKAGWLSPTTLLGRLMQSGIADRFWAALMNVVRARPGRVLIISVACMVPFAIVGGIRYDDLSYGLLSELPDDYVSVQGVRAAQEHFPAGSTGPVIVMLSNPTLDFADDGVLEKLGELALEVENRRGELDVADIRSAAEPTGITRVAREKLQQEDAEIEKLKGPEKFARIRVRNQRIRDYYFTPLEHLNHSITRIDVVFRSDPFSRDSVENFTRFRNAFTELVEEFDGKIRSDLDELEAEGEEVPDFGPTEIAFLGATASIADLKEVTDRDQIRIDVLVLIVVYLILVVLLRKPMISLYLLASVFFTFFVSMGVTYGFFYFLDPVNFGGIDWKVPVFLFTILIAVGEDYNILLMTRIEEEQQTHGLVEGVLVALKRTGSIISSCGVIMAGTFSSLVLGTLLGMQQLGFALAFGVLLDTFVVRPILVPAWLVLLYRGRFGKFGRFLGTPESVLAETDQDASS